MNVVDQFTMAFLINFLPPNLRTKVLESNPTTMKQCVYNAHEIQRMIWDKTRVGSTTQKAKVFAVEEEAPASDLEELLVNLMKKHWPPKPNNANCKAMAATKGKARTPRMETTPMGTPPTPKRSATTVASSTTAWRTATPGRPTRPRATLPRENRSTRKESNSTTHQEEPVRSNPQLPYPPQGHRIFPIGSERVPSSGPRKDLQLCNVNLFAFNRVNKHFFQSLLIFPEYGTIQRKSAQNLA